MFDLLEQRTEGRGQRTDFSVRRAVTLIELLVVISIMLMLAVYALPKLGPMANRREIRETARAVSVYLSRARSRAIETGRPCGVIFHRVDTPNTNEPLSNAAIMLSQTEVPAPYAGSTLSARVTMTASPLRATVVTPGDIQPNFLCVGDRMQINNQGPWYTIIGPDEYDVDGILTPDDDVDGLPDGDGFIDGSIPTTPGSPIADLDFAIDPKYKDSLPWTGTSDELSFKIFRQPSHIRTIRTVAPPLSLPAGTAIDLSASGTDAYEYGKGFGTGQGDIIIMFSPTGAVNRFYYQDIGSKFIEAGDAIEPIFLLIGWRNNIGRGRQQIVPPPPLGQPQNPGIYPQGNFDPDNPPDIDEELPNWQILSNMWVGINSQSGLITVAENTYPKDTYRRAQNNDGISWNDGSWPYPALKESRQYARRAQSKGGR